jgi:hypothetical protein
MKRSLPLSVASLLLSLVVIMIGPHLSAGALLVSASSCLMAACLTMGRSLRSQAEER